MKRSSQKVNRWSSFSNHNKQPAVVTTHKAALDVYVTAATSVDSDWKPCMTCTLVHHLLYQVIHSRLLLSYIQSMDDIIHPGRIMACIKYMLCQIVAMFILYLEGSTLCGAYRHPSLLCRMGSWFLIRQPIIPYVLTPCDFYAKFLFHPSAMESVFTVRIMF